MPAFHAELWAERADGRLDAVALGYQEAGLTGEDLESTGQLSVDECAVVRAVAVHLLHAEFLASLRADIHLILAFLVFLGRGVYLVVHFQFICSHTF